MSYFHISHKKFGNEYVYFKDKFWPKSPVVKYSPEYEHDEYDVPCREVVCRDRVKGQVTFYDFMLGCLGLTLILIVK